MSKQSSTLVTTKVIKPLWPKDFVDIADKVKVNTAAVLGEMMGMMRGQPAYYITYDGQKPRMNVTGVLSLFVSDDVPLGRRSAYHKDDVYSLTFSFAHSKFVTKDLSADDKIIFDEAQMAMAVIQDISHTAFEQIKASPHDMHAAKKAFYTTEVVNDKDGKPTKEKREIYALKEKNEITARKVLAPNPAKGYAESELYETLQFTPFYDAKLDKFNIAFCKVDSTGEHDVALTKKNIREMFAKPRRAVVTMTFDRMKWHLGGKTLALNSALTYAKVLITETKVEIARPSFTNMNALLQALPEDMDDQDREEPTHDDASTTTSEVPVTPSGADPAEDTSGI